MSEYRRFVAYIYAYQNGRKQKNTGYVKVDARNRLCRMQVHVQTNEMKNREMHVYGFVRVNGVLLGLPLGEGITRNGNLTLRLAIGMEDIGGSGYGLDQLSGVWIKGIQQEDYISIWDEGNVDVEKFTLELPRVEARMAAESEGISPTEDIVAEAKEISPTEDIMAEAEAVSPVEDMTVECVRSRENQWTDAGSLAGRWPQFLCHYPAMQPFEGTQISCIRIAPKDISFLGEQEWRFGRNPFLQQGYGRYRHLLLGRTEDGQFFLGVPGMFYDMQDQHLARMYGFPEFRKASQCQEMQLPEGESQERFGYWCHFLKK